MKKIDKIIKAQTDQKIAFIWAYKGQECPFIQLTDAHFIDQKLIKSFADYSLIEQDLLIARECFEQLNTSKPENQAIGRSIFSDAITSYGRCFTEGEGKNVILDPNQIFKGLPTERSIHEWMMETRHRFFAHSGGSKNEIMMVYLALNPDMKSGPIGIYRGLVKTSNMGEKSNNDAIITINSALDWVKVKIDKAHLKIRELLNKNSIDSLYKQAQTPESLEGNVLKISTKYTDNTHYWGRIATYD